MNTDSQAVAREALLSLTHMPCWYVSSGEGVCASFKLALGGKVKRDVEIKNLKHSELYRTFKGEVNLLVWCSWRLERGPDILCTSKYTHEDIDVALAQLVGLDIVGVTEMSPMWDFRMSFSDKTSICIFCDNGDDDCDRNWTLSFSGRSIWADSKGRVCVEVNV